jgi:lipopolysaccharide transport system permease protein
MSIASTPDITVRSPRRKLKVRPRQGWQPIDFSELWHYRELLLILALRDIQVRYKQTLLGIMWALIQPFVQMVVFTLLFAKNGFSTDGVAAPVFYFSGLLPWLLFANSLSAAGNSLINNQNLITKVYFPRLVIPISAGITGLIDFTISFAFLIVLMGYYHIFPTRTAVLLPVFIVFGSLCALAVGLWLSALNVRYRDVHYIISFLMQFWFFITPVIYPASIVTARWKKAVLGLNPMSGVVEGFRWAVYGRPTPGLMTVVSLVTVLAVLVGGLFYFRRIEKTFADVV